LLDQLDVEPGFFLRLAYGCIFRRFAVVDEAARERPAVRRILALDEDDVSGADLDDDVRRRGGISVLALTHPSKLRGFEGIARSDVAGLHTAAEPAHALLGATVRERLRHHGALRLRLQPIVADRAGGVEPFLDVAFLE